MTDLPTGWRKKRGAHYLRTYVAGRQRELYLGKTMDAALHRYVELMSGAREGVYLASPDGDEPAALYRHFDAAGALLYVGVSVDVLARTANHLRDAHWSRQIAQITVARFESRSEALRAEWLAIYNERPKHNTMHAQAPLLGVEQGGRSKKRGSSAA